MVSLTRLRMSPFCPCFVAIVCIPLQKLLGADKGLLFHILDNRLITSSKGSAEFQPFPQIVEGFAETVKFVIIQCGLQLMQAGLQLKHQQLQSSMRTAARFFRRPPDANRSDPMQSV